MQRQSLATRLLATTLLALLALAAGLMLVMMYFMNFFTDTIMLSMLQPLAKTAALGVEGNLHTLADRFFLIRENRLFFTPNSSAMYIRHSLDVASSGMEFDWLAIYEMDGALLAGSEDSPGNISGRRLYRLIQKTKNLVIDDTSIGTGGLEIVIGVPVVYSQAAEGEAASPAEYYLVGSYKYDVLGDVLRNINISANGTAFILNESGNFIAHKDLGKVFSGQSVMTVLGDDPNAQALLTNIRQGQTGATGIDCPTGRAFVSYAPIHGTPWSLGILAPRDDFLMTYRQALMTSATITCITLVSIAILLSLYMRKALSVPLRTLSVNARLLSQGKLDNILPAEVAGRNDEIGKLAETFISMSGTVRKIIHDIDTLLRAARFGAFGKRGDAAAYYGDYQLILSGMNMALDVFCAQLDSMPGALIIFDRLQNPVYLNSSGHEILKRHNLRRTDPSLLSAFLVEDAAKMLPPEVVALFDSGSRDSPMYKKTIALMDGENREYNYALSLGRAGSDVDAVAEDSLCVTLILNDVTQLTKARIGAEAASRAKSDFLSRMSHEMRTPMNAILGMTSIGLGTDEADRREYCLHRINEASQHLLGIINDILDMSKIEAGKFELSADAFGLHELLEQVARLISFKITEKKQYFVVNISEAMPRRIFGDKQRLIQVLTNLLSNAVKFTQEEGVITLNGELVTEADGYSTLLFEVRDTGIGISAEQQAKLFASFEQADGGMARKFGGTGLGLAISKNIIELMGGRIWVESTPGEGAAFFFEITMPVAGAQDGSSPLSEQEKSLLSTGEQEGVEQTDAGDLLSTENIFVGKRVLIAEDVDINREIVAALLEHTGVQIDFAEDGAAAVEKFSGSPDVYSMILMDIHMPNVDGYEATRRIRASNAARAKTVPIVAMTANVFKEDVQRCLDSGMNDHLGKPINAEEVIATMTRYMG